MDLASGGLVDVRQQVALCVVLPSSFCNQCFSLPFIHLSCVSLFVRCFQKKRGQGELEGKSTFPDFNCFSSKKQTDKVQGHFGGGGGESKLCPDLLPSKPTSLIRPRFPGNDFWHVFPLFFWGLCCCFNNIYYTNSIVYYTMLYYILGSETPSLLPTGHCLRHMCGDNNSI